MIQQPFAVHKYSQGLNRLAQNNGSLTKGCNNIGGNYLVRELITAVETSEEALNSLLDVLIRSPYLVGGLKELEVQVSGY